MQAELTKHYLEIHMALASGGAASHEGRHRANSIVRRSFLDNANHNVRGLWDSCFARVEKEWQQDPIAHFPVLSALTALLATYDHPRAKEHVQEMLAKVLWWPMARVKTNERSLLEKLELAQEVAAQTAHLKRARRREPMTEVAMVDFMLKPLPAYMLEYLARLPEDKSQETWDEIMVHLSEAQEHNNREGCQQGHPGGGQATRLAALGSSVTEAAPGLRFVCESQGGYGPMALSFYSRSLILRGWSCVFVVV